MGISKERKIQIKAAVMKVFEMLSHSDPSLPLAVEKIPKMLGNCTLVPYSRVASKERLSYVEVAELMSSYDASTLYDSTSNRYLIYYNDMNEQIMESNRYRWNIAHEIGHICLRHLQENNRTRISRRGLSDDEYYHLETEADCFAAYLLVPHTGLYASNISTRDELRDFRDLCKISSLAASSRYSNYQQWKKKNNGPDNWTVYDKYLFKIYQDAQARKKCTNCNHVLHDNFAKYCPICGGNLDYTLEDTMTIHSGIKTNQFGRPIECPVCGNEEILCDSFFCQICGAYIVNACTNPQCDHFGQSYPGNARRCPYCQSETTYVDKGYLEKSPFDVVENWKNSVPDDDPFAGF